MYIKLLFIVHYVYKTIIYSDVEMGVGPAELTYYCPAIPVCCDMDLGLSDELKAICNDVMSDHNMDIELHAVSGGLQYHHDNFFINYCLDEDPELGTFRE